MAEGPRSVLMVLEATFPAHGGGGAESQVLTLSRALADRGVRVRLVAPRVPGGPQAARENVDGLEVVRIAYPRVHLFGGLILLAKLAAYLVRHRRDYSVIHAHIAHNMASVCALVGRMLGKPVFVKITGPHELVGGILDPNPDLASRLRKAAILRATTMHAISGRIRQVLIDRGFKAERVLWLPNGVDTNRFSRRPREAALRAKLCGDARLVGVCAARLVAEKDHELLLHAWSDALGKSSDVKLVLVGDGVLREPLRDLAARLGITDQVVFAGHADDVAPYLSIADFALLTSRGEGLSNSLLEYMAMGLPVVGSRVSGTEDYVVTGQTGWLFESGRRDELARALATVGAAAETELRRIGDEARNRILTTASVDAVTREWIRRYGFAS